MTHLAALATAAHSLAPLIFCAVIIGAGSVLIAFLLFADEFDPMSPWMNEGREPGELPEVER